MAAQSFAQLLARLNTRVGDTTNRTLSITEKTEALNSAYNDPYVFQIARDNSTAISSTLFSYSVPGSITDVLELQIDSQSDGIGDRIDHSMYEVIGGIVYFKRAFKTYLGTYNTKALIFIGRSKLSTTDLVPDNVQEYVLTLAAINCAEIIKGKKTLFFLKNGLTMSDILADISSLKQEAARLRATLIGPRSVTL